MLIAVCLKQVISRESTLRVNNAGTWVKEDDVAWTMGESDGFALEEAFRLREKYPGEVVAISHGPSRASTLLRDALARGADRAIHVVDELSTPLVDPHVIASALAQGLAAEHPDLVLTGLQSDDLGFAQVGVLLAELLGNPHASIATAIDITAQRVRVKRELEGGWMQWVSMPLPAVVTMQSGTNPLRFSTLRGIMAAKKKEIRTVPAPRDVQSRQRILSVSTPLRRRATQMIAGDPQAAARELVRLLRGQKN